MASMERWARIKYQPVLPLGENNTKITGCRAHVDLSRKAAEEGIVLLKNENSELPLKKNTKVAIFGKAQIDYVKVGGGSGEVHSEYTVNIYDAMKMQGGVSVYNELSEYYNSYVEEAYKQGGKNGRLAEPKIPESLLEGAKQFTDTAIVTICRYSGEGWDRRNDGVDCYFNLSNEELEMVDTVSNNFKRVIVLLNVGAMMDTSWFATNPKISSVLMIWQGGMEGALAAANVLVGKCNPSGKLVDTCAMDFDDYPSSLGFHESADYVKYTEDVFVGYRYFETIPGKSERVVYPFGYGLSYTKFEFSDISASLKDENVEVRVNVKNIGSCDGKEVVQVYYNAPLGKITKPRLELAAFAKTKMLKPQEMQTIVLKFALNSMASYDDIGDVCKSAWVLEKGKYSVFVGNSVKSVSEVDFDFYLENDVICEQLTEYCAPEKLHCRLNALGEYITVSNAKPSLKTFKTDYVCKYVPPVAKEDKKLLVDVACGKVSIDDFVSQLSDPELLALLKGKHNTGVANTGGMGGLSDYGIPSPMTVDGPAGVRINACTGVRTTAFPIATMLACTWNTELVEEIGKAGAIESKENNLSIWLTPALNIHRSPLCGRNFEYYSEDPLVAGKMAAAMVRGIQSQKIVATPKHFACNNKETNRKESDSILSERALREIYIKGFEICVKESSPKLVMTAYNLINGIRASENAELIMGILRGEWGYDGLVTTDWNNTASQTKEVLAGNDIRMPATTTEDLAEGFSAGAITRDEIAVCVKRLLEMILWLE